MPTTEKIDQVGQLVETLNSSKAVYLADFTGVDVASVTQLRSELRQASIGYQVVKNRLAKLAVAQAGMDDLDEYFTGPTAIAYSEEDPVEPAKILQKFIEDGGKLTLKSGFVDGQLVSSDQIQALASLPSREELYGKVVGGIQAPLYGFAAVLSGLLRNLVGALAALEEKKRGEEA
ncbi:MAG: 50S ribosomal protein L10 [Candidatus Latescibacteria bacterium]|nr:50S ribosomal protein L10 [Candidatus Latescibacterota bacterium]